MGCNSVCSYCIVPSVRGKEVSRRSGEILAEVEGLARDGVRELTLLGQNVNSYGRDVGSSFDELLRACDAVEGIERIRFTSPHPKDFRAPVIAAMAECDTVCEHAHLPLQSGSTRVLKAMRRTYSRERYLRLVGELRAAIPDLALTTDLIVGFPGETRGRVRGDGRARSKRSATTAPSPSSTHRGQGTEAASMADQVPEDVKRERIERLIEVVQRVARRGTASGSAVSRKSWSRGRAGRTPSLLRGRTRRNTTVNFAGTASAESSCRSLSRHATSTTLKGTQLAAVAA